MHSPLHITKRLLREFCDDREGAVALVVGLSLIVIIGVAALAIDGGYLYWTRAQLQATTDSAALAGVAMVPGNDGTLTAQEKDDIVDEAKSFAQKNMRISQYGTVLATAGVIPGHWDAGGDFGAARTFYPINNLPGGADIDAVKTIARRDTLNGNPVNLMFASILGFSETNVGATAIAWAGPGDGQACILSLHPDLDGAIEMSGTNDLDLDNCGIALHSTSDKAMKISGTVDLEVGEVCVKHSTQGVEESGTVTWDPNPPDIENDCDPPNDPLAGVAPPDTSGCDHTDFKVDVGFSVVTLDPGVYCNGIELSGSNIDVTFNPGDYVLKDGGLKISGSDSTISGSEIMFYNTDNGGSYGNIDISGSSNTTNIDFSAPTSGTYAGILFFGDRSSSEGDFLWKLAGASDSVTMDGVVYMPTQLVEFSGDANLTGPCGVKIISRTIKFNGNDVTFPAPGGGCAADNVSIPLGTQFILVL